LVIANYKNQGILKVKTHFKERGYLMEFYYNLKSEDIKDCLNALNEFFKKFRANFRTKTREVSKQGQEYIKGLLLCEGRRNMSRMSEEVTEINEQALSHFISESPWKEEEIIKKIGEEAAKEFSKGVEEKSFIIDESGIVKDGKLSVGVARQYCGSIGKRDNCQVGVYLGYTNGQEGILIDKKLYLPRVWSEDNERCENAGIPKEKREFKTKGELGLEMLFEARKRGLPGEYVSMDGFYGQQPEILNKLDEVNEIYFADIPGDTRIYLKYPEIGIPKKKGKRGKNPSKVRVLEDTAIEVRELPNTDQLEWHTVKVRDTQRGELWINFAALRIYRIYEKLPVEEPLWLLIREELDGSDIKFTFSNSDENTPLEVLAKRQNTRYFIERAIQDAKELAGMDEYQVTGWRGWNHHMTMVLLTMLFLLEFKNSIIQKAPMITLKDLTDLLKQILPVKVISLLDRLKIICKRHLNRYYSRISRLKKQHKQLQLSFI
jgi:SRSO17 transposase